MISDFHKYIAYLKDEGMQKELSLYAQILRNERLKRRLTLGEVANGICSISYLSKFENSCVVFNEVYVKALFEKMDLDYNKVSSNTWENLIEECLKHYFYYEHEDIFRIYEEVKDYSFTSTLVLMECFYFIQEKDIANFEKNIKTLDTIKYTLGGLESVVYIYLIICYYIILNQYGKALEYLKGLELLDINNKYLNYLIMEANLIVAFNLNNGCLLLNIYRLFEGITSIGYPIGRRMEMKMIYNVYRANEFGNEVLEDVNSLDYSMLPNDNKTNILFYRYLVKLKYESLDKVFNEIVSNNYVQDVRFLGLCAYLAYNLNEKKYYETLLTIVDSYQFKNGDFVHHKFCCFVLLYASNISDHDLLDYMRKDIIPRYNIEVNILYNEIYRIVYSNLLVNESKYKEAYYFSNNDLKGYRNRKIVNKRK